MRWQTVLVIADDLTRYERVLTVFRDRQCWPVLLSDADQAASAIAENTYLQLVVLNRPHTASPGKLLAANKGTVYFDEIGDMSPCGAQVLRVIEAKKAAPWAVTLSAFRNTIVTKARPASTWVRCKGESGKKS